MTVAFNGRAGGSSLLRDSCLVRGRLLLSLLFVAALLSANLPAMAQSSGLTFRVLTSSAPNRYTAINSDAWNDYVAWAGRALDSIQNNKGNIGDPAADPGAFQISGSVMPRLWAVSSEPSWRGKLSPAGEFAPQYGNALHFVLHVKGDGTVQFKYEDMSWCVWRTGQQGGVVCNNMELTRPHSAGAWDRIDCTYGTGIDWGADNAKGGGDDTEVCGGTQTNRGNFDSTPVDEVFYVGASYAHAFDYRFNKPSEFPDYASWTLQEHFDDRCDFFNSDSGHREIGLEFTIVDTGGNTHTYVAKRGNPEFGRPMQPGLCVAWPPTPTPNHKAAAPTPGPTKVPVHTGESLNAQGYLVSATYGLQSGVQFQRVDASGVGNAAALAAGFLDAIDVWGYAEQGVTVCFRKDQVQGGLMFLDATTSPRTLMPLDSYMSDGRICATIYGPGTILLVSNGAPTAVPEASIAQSQQLANCMVTTLYELNFRKTPGGELIGNGIPYNSTLTALERTDGWIKVDYHGVQGWISADYVTTSGGCG